MTVPRRGRERQAGLQHLGKGGVDGRAAEVIGDDGAVGGEEDDVRDAGDVEFFGQHL